MSTLIGQCFRFYIDHFSDMEAFYKQGYIPPANVSGEKWKKVRAVISQAGLQATGLLRGCASVLVSTLHSPGARKLELQNQRATLDRDWNLRVFLYSPDYKSFAEAGVAIDVPQNGRAELGLWLASWSKSKTVQRDLLHVLHEQGVKSARAVDDGRWPAHYVLLESLELAEGVEVDTCKRWVSQATERTLLRSWDEIRRMLA